MTSNTPFANVPPDPECMNDQRAAWAQLAISAFQDATGTDHDDALCDLLCDLMHWADRHRISFAAQLRRGRYHYGAETAGDDL